MSDVPEQLSTLWNVAQTLVLAPLAWFLKASIDRVSRLEESVAKTRENMAENYIKKADLKGEMDRVIDRLDRFEDKLDKVIERNAP